MEKAEPTANPTRVPTGPPINVPTAVESATEPPVHQTFKGGSFEPPYRKCSTLTISLFNWLTNQPTIRYKQFFQ